MKKRTHAADQEIEGGDESVVAQLGLQDAGELQVKVQVAAQLNALIDELGWTQDRIARELGISQPHVSDLRRYKLRRFSTERLIKFFTALNQDVLITVRRAAGSTESGEVIVRRAA